MRRQQQPQPDCTTCRVLGAGVCLGTSGYLALQMYANPPSSLAHRWAGMVLVTGLISLGVYRAIM